MEKKFKILIIEDDEGIQESLKVLLGDKYSLKTAGLGNDGLSDLKAFNPNLVLLDLILPDTDGLSVLKRIRTSDENLPVIMITAYKSIKNTKKALELGVTDFIYKPFNRNELTSIIEKVLFKTGLPNEGQDTYIDFTKFDISSIITQNPAMLKVFREINHISKTDSS
ncbi:MAG: response regulator, partial [bacterium]|nr:response regulator [bacterium]